MVNDYTPTTETVSGNKINKNKTVDAATIMQYEQGAQAFIEYGMKRRENEILEILQASYESNIKSDTLAVGGLLAAIILIKGETE